MTTTTNLGITLIDTNQSQKEVTHNEGFEKFDSILTESVDVAIDDGTNAVSSATMLSAARLKLTPGSVSAAFDVELPAIKRELIVTNKTTYDAHVMCAGAAPGASEAIVEPNATAKIYCDAAEVVATAGGTNPSGAFVFTDLLDAPNAFTGAARKHVAVNAAETGLEFVESDFAIVEKSADYTLTLDDTGKLVAMNDVGPLTLTVPPQSDEAWTTGTIIYAMQLGAGQVTVAAGSGVTVMTPASMKTRAQYSEVKLTCVDTDLWTLTGDLEGSVGTNSFVGQTDTPASYTGSSGKLLAVNGGGTAVEFVVAPYDVGCSIIGKPDASEVVMRFVATRAFTLPASLTGSQGQAGTAATAQTDFDVQKNGSSIGTVRFAASGTTASFIAASPQTFAAGDVLSMVAPVSADATLADISFTFAGIRG